jgi:16S rRNA (guanine527-N7)-methyltransferase
MVVRKHFIDSAILVLSEKYKNNSSNDVLDLGTGAGFPGMVLAILRPQDDFTLVDSLNKRTDFLKIVIEELDLYNVQVFHGRAEDYGQNEEFRNQFDFVVSRAVAELPILLEYCIPFTEKNGYFVSYKGPKYKEEIQQAENALKQLSAEVETIEKYEMNDGEEERYLVFIKNTQLTNEKYPRRAGMPKKKPL